MTGDGMPNEHGDAVAPTVGVASGSVGIRIDPEVAAAMKTARQLLVAHSKPDVARRAHARLTEKPEIPTVVVVGEVKRGKSSLVNSILAQDGLSPVGVDITTAAFLKFVPASDATQGEMAKLVFAGRRTVEVDRSEVADWVTVDGRHVNDPSVAELPIGAEVCIQSSTLPGAALVDTPGAGGLDRRHLTLALDAASTASVLILVCDASAPLTSAELQYLDIVGSEVDSVLVAMTKIDKNLTHWRAIADENRRLLGTFAPRYKHVPVLGVSSLLAASARRRPAGPQRERALSVSGVDALVAMVTEAVGARESLPVANGVRTAISGLRTVSVALTAERSAINDDAGVRASLMQEKERLQALQVTLKGGWREFLTSDLNQLQRTTISSLETKLAALRSEWRERIESTGIALIRKAPQLMIAEMTADIEALTAELSAEFTVELRAMVASLFPEDSDVGLRAGTIEELSETKVLEAYTRRRLDGLVDPQILTMGVMGANMVGGLMVGVVAGALVPVVGAAFGGVWVAVNLGYRAIRQGRQALIAWLNETLQATKRDMVVAIQTSVETVRPDIVTSYRMHLEESINALVHLLRRADAAGKQSAVERADSLVEIDSRLTTVDAAISALETQLARISQNGGTFSGRIDS